MRPNWLGTLYWIPDKKTLLTDLHCTTSLHPDSAVGFVGAATGLSYWAGHEIAHANSDHMKHGHDYPHP